VGSKTFIEKVKGLLGFRAMEMEVKEGGGGYQLREGAAHKSLFGPEKRDTGPNNTYFWDTNYE
jgi:hypothetical protein